MAIQWGAYEGGMRVGIDVDISAVNTNSDDVTFTVRYYTDNSQSFSDSQTLNLSGHIGGSIGYTNDESGSSGAVQRGGARTHTYNYSTWGSSPGTRTFTVSASGLYTGGTPSKSVTVTIPARPIAAPNPPTAATASRISDTQTKITWTRNPTNQRPYETQTLWRRINGGSWSAVSSGFSGSTTSYTNGTTANNKYEYQVRANNDAGSSAFDLTNVIYTTPAAPTLAARADIAGPGQRITWNNDAVGYANYTSEVFASKNDGAWTSLGTVASGVTTFDHLGSNPVAYTAADRWKYIVRHYASNGNTRLYSADSNVTSETAGVTSPPNAPTNLTPTGGVALDPSVAIPLEWQHNPTDTSDQTQYQIRHRVVGAGAWTTLAPVASSVKSHSLAAGTYTNGQNVEWQVSTKGADAAFGPFSASATFIALVSKKIPVYLDSGTGRYIADLAGLGWTGLAKPSAKVRRDATQSFGDGITTDVSWDTNVWMRDGCTAGSAGITVPIDGWYRLTANHCLNNSGLLTAGGANAVLVSRFKVGSAQYGFGRSPLSPSAPTVHNGSLDIFLTAGSVVTTTIYHNNNGSRSTWGGTEYHTSLSVVYIGPAA